MKSIEQYIESRQSEFAQHPFFAEDRLGFELRHALAFAPDLTFWVMAFQDVLRVNARLTVEPEIRKIVRHHRAEDAGHERWFLDDLEAMKFTAPDVRALFGKKHTPTRDAAYALVAEVYRVQDDRLRLVLVKTLESAGHIFFGRVAAVVDRAGGSKLLKYFSFSHLEIEKSHEVFEQEISKTVSAIRLEPGARAEAKALVDRCYAAFNGMFDSLCSADTRQVKIGAGAALNVANPAPRRQRARTPQVGITVAASTTSSRQVRSRT